MDIQSEKLELIHWLSEIQDAELLAKIRKIKETTDQYATNQPLRQKSNVDQFLGALPELNVDVEEEVRNMREEWNRREEKQWKKST